MISFDIETLGVSSEVVVLSVGVVKFELHNANNAYQTTDKNYLNGIYQKMLADSLFVKFEVDEQVVKYGRKVEKDAIDFWKEQSAQVVDRSFRRNSALDVKAEDGITKIAEFCNGDQNFWARGSLDQIVYDSLCRAAGKPLVTEYWCWSDYRTAINLTKETARKGYCDIPGFDRSLVVKHDPVHDAAYDVMMLLYGK